MKKIISGLLSLAMMVTVIGTPLGENVRTAFGTHEIEANAEVSGDYQYEILNNGTVIITYYNGSASSLSIPSSINGRKVTQIGSCAFMNRMSLVSVTIPSSVTDIGYAAFISCTSLKSVKMTKGVKNIGDYAFYGCLKLSSVTIPNSVKIIGELAFGDCWSLKSISIPKSVTEIRDLAFGYGISDYDETGNVVYYAHIPAFEIRCYIDSKGEEYAGDNRFVFRFLDSLPNVTGFKAAAGSSSTIKLSWNKVNGAEGYVIYRYNTSTKKYQRIAKSKNLTFTDKKLASGKSYKYAVRAYKYISGTEVLSKSYPEATAVTKPADVTGFKAASSSESTIKLTWNKASGADGYIVYRYNNSTKKYERIAKGKNLSFTDKNLVLGKSYKYAVRAYKTAGKKEILSTSYPQITAKTSLSNVTGFKSASASENSIKLTWNKVNGADGYIVYRYNTSAKKYERVTKTKNLTYTDNKLTLGNSYKYAVRAYKTVGKNEILSTSYPQITAKTSLSNVTGFKSSAVSDSAVKLTWNKVSGADGYIVYRYNTSIKKYERIAKAERLEFTDENLAPGTSFKYAIRAYKIVNGKELLSPSFPEAVTSTPPSDVTDFTASSSSGTSIDLTWSESEGADGYVVYRFDTEANKYVRITKIEDLELKDENLTPGTSYKYAIRAYKTINGKEVLSRSYPSITYTLNAETSED